MGLAGAASRPSDRPPSGSPAGRRKAPPRSDRQMWALRKLEAAPGATVTDLPLPELRAGEVTVRVRTASICGTDLPLMRWNAWAERRVHPPLTLGHECAGEVVAVGDGV